MRPPLNESKFIRVYRELTGASEAQARSAFMYACCAEDAGADGVADLVDIVRPDPRWEESRHEPDTEPRSLPRLHQLSDATRERFA